MQIAYDICYVTQILSPFYAYCISTIQCVNTNQQLVMHIGFTLDAFLKPAIL